MAKMKVVELAKGRSVVETPIEHARQPQALPAISQSLDRLAEAEITVRPAGGQIDDEARACRIDQPEKERQALGARRRKIPSGKPKCRRRHPAEMLRRGPFNTWR